MKTIAFYTLGCKVNQYETEAMKEIFLDNGYNIKNFDEFADVYVINTCTVTNLGDRKSRQAIRKAKKQNPNSVVAVVGCYSQTSPDEVKNIEGVNIVLGTNDRTKIINLVEDYFNKNENIISISNILNEKSFEDMKISGFEGRTRAYIKIQEGCEQYCSYCIIPYARGKVRSRNPMDIYNEALALSQKGFFEIVFTGIHIASYGKDLDNLSLIDVIKMVHNIEGIKRIRLSSIEPTLITKEFVSEIKKLPRLCPHFHLSLQSGCLETLKRMNRKYTPTDYENAVILLRNSLESVAFTTDVMVGFPGETNDEFLSSYNFIKKIGFMQIHTFKYSKRKNTPAALFNNQIDEKVKEERSKKIIELSNVMQKKFFESCLLKEFDVLIEKEVEKNVWEGHTPNYIKVLINDTENLEGKIVKCLLIEVKDDYMQGKIVDRLT